MADPAPRFPEVDSLRAVAALAVLGTHAAIFAGAAYPGSEVGRYTQRLEVGLTIFFVISGFLLYRPFVAARAARSDGPRVVGYAWRRFLRIAPAYWLALTVSAVVLTKSEVFSGEGVPVYYLLAQAYDRELLPGGLTQAWTLTVEVAFYAFLPVWAWVMRRVPGTSLRAEVAGLAVLALASAVYKAVVLSGMDPQQVVVTPALIALPSYLDQFALGMGLAVLTVWTQRAAGAPAVARLVDRRPLVPWAVALVAFWVVSTRIGIGERLFEAQTPAQYLARHWLYALIGVMLVLPAVVGTPRAGAVRRLLANPVLAWLGLVSYGIYLWHFTGLELLRRWGVVDDLPLHPYLAWPLAGLALAAAVAAVSWYALERPALGLKRLVSGGRTRPARLPVAPERR
jgi:peptidoglycan/LPS O-acetylase OafA/YrhL